MLEFKKKTRAHKWCNYAVYGLLTLSQLSNSGFLTTILSRFHFRKLSPMDKRFSLSHTVAYTPPWECPPSSRYISQQKSTVVGTQIPSLLHFHYKQLFNNIRQKRATKNYLRQVFGNIGLKGESGLNPTYALLTNSQQKRAAKNYLRQVFGNIGLKGGSLSPSVLAKNKGTAVFRLVSARTDFSSEKSSCNRPTSEGICFAIE